jgi:uncharacterized protein with NRDE domain
MCLIAYAWRAHAHWPLVLIGNRDERHARPTDAADFLQDAPDVYGGRDREQGGGWLQVSRQGRLAAVTNVRDGLVAPVAPHSRGALVHDFVRTDVDVDTALARLSARAEAYGRFNLLLWDGKTLALASNHPHFHVLKPAPGVHALSNGPLHARWPKMQRVADMLTEWLARVEEPAPDTTALFVALADTEPAPEDALPDTRVGLALEKQLSSPFILGETYGTRCSSVVRITSDCIDFEERQYGPGGVALGQSRQRIDLT